MAGSGLRLRCLWLRYLWLNDNIFSMCLGILSGPIIKQVEP